MKKIIFTLSFIAALLYTANAQVIAFNTASYSSAVAKQQAFTQSYSSNTPLTLTATTTSVSSGMNPSSVGEKAIFTATVTGKLYIAPGPTGSVDFFDQTTGIDLGMISLDNDGHASLGIATLTAGRHIINAVYSGDANYDASTGYLDNIYQVVNEVQTARVTTTSVGSNAMDHSIFLGQNVTFTATVTGQVYVAPGPAGSVDFFDQSTGIDLGMASLDNDGNASINTSTLALGMHIIAAHYSGNADFDASTGYYSNPGLAVYQATVTSVGSSLNPSVFGQSVTFTATVTVPSPGTGTPTGSVDFFDQSTGTDLGVVSLDNEGSATVSIATLTEGTHIIGAHYSGDANYIFTTGYYDNPGQVVTKLATTTSVSSSMNPSLVGQNVTFTASVIAQSQVTPGPTGEVTFYDMSTSTYVGKVSLDNDGNASISIATLTAGTHNISALYNGDDNFSSSSGYYDTPGQVVTPSMTFYRDADGDGYGDPNVTIQASSAPTGYVSNNTDCDDTHATVYPGAPELCDGLDNNCNGQIDEGCVTKNVRISIIDKSAIEGNKGQKIMNFQVLLNKKSHQVVTVNYATQDSTAIAPGDYIATSGTLTFTAGVKRQLISVYINGDKSIEPDETFKVRLSNPVNAAILDRTAVGTILNNDGISIAVNAIGTEENVVANTRQLQVSPNPASSKVNVTLKGYKGNVVIQMSTIEGKILHQDKVQILSAKYAQQSINVSDYANGVYFVTVIDEAGNRQTAKLVVQH